MSNYIETLNIFEEAIEGLARCQRGLNALGHLFDDDAMAERKGEDGPGAEFEAWREELCALFPVVAEQIDVHRGDAKAAFDYLRHEHSELADRLKQKAA